MEDKEDKEESVTLPARDFTLQVPRSLLLVQSHPGVPERFGRSFRVLLADLWVSHQISLNVGNTQRHELRVQ